jgi:tRNA pseudouridine13 synthase
MADLGGCRPICTEKLIFENFYLFFFQAGLQVHILVKTLPFKKFYTFLLIMAIIKHLIDDFVVKEILGINLSNNVSSIGIYLMKKRNYTTERAVFQISKSLHIQRKFIGYAGSKDKPAVTYQYISIKGCSKEKVLSLKLKDIELEFVGFSKEDIKLGDLNGNTFEIVVRDLPKNLDLKKLNVQNADNFYVPNYFDEQRFSEANLKIGLFLIKNDFKSAVELIVQTDGDFKDEINQYLETHKNDFHGALKKLPNKTILFFIHSVQSFFFNEILADKIKKEFKDVFEVKYSEGIFSFPKLFDSNKVNILKSMKLPLIGYMTEDCEEILSKHNLIARNFLIRSLPDFSLEGSDREAFFEVNDFSISGLIDDEEFSDKKKCVVKFSLGSGSYATIVLKYLFSQSNNDIIQSTKEIREQNKNNDEKVDE